MTDVTRILEAVEAGDPCASAELLPIVYDELRRLAAAQMARQRPDHTLCATALVHEAYLRLVGVGGQPDQQWKGRAHFYAAAAEAMKRILIENARRRRQIKRGGALARRELDPELLTGPEAGDDIEALGEALDKLARIQPGAALVVRLRYFAGLTLKEAATTLGISKGGGDDAWNFHANRGFLLGVCPRLAFGRTPRQATLNRVRRKFYADLRESGRNFA
jgi:RNA polymerase sigma factor (TIGR02999 family)